MMRARPTAVTALALSAMALLAMQQARPADGVARSIPSPNAYANDLIAAVSTESLARYHDLIATEPHVAGTPGDERQIARIAKAFQEMGLPVQVQWFRCLLARPTKALLEIVEGAPQLPAGASRGVVPLQVNERNLAEDPATAHPDLTFGWNAYSGNGDVTASVVYANYGLREDYDALKAAGVDVKGKIVLVRYGRCFRGFKARFAQERGAAGVLLYTDPADAGFSKGKVWPQGGGWANDNCLQRGTLNTLPYPGDPGTPGVFSADNVVRDDPSRLDLPKIPVQPIGYGAAGTLLTRFQGAEVPESWRGGLGLTYRYDGGDALKVHLVVEQERYLGRSGNVIAAMPGAGTGTEFTVIGCHHDAWGYGAADPGAGTMCLLEAARCVAEAGKRGIAPLRTIVFAAWGAEEFGIIGSTEWCEAHDVELRRDAVLYANLDMAAMGPNPGLSISPELDSLVRQAAKLVPAAGAPAESVLARIERGAGDRPLFGALGGGSDHVAFVCREGVPSVAISAGGSQGTSYHSNYDTVKWYRSVVGDDYAPAAMVTRLALAMTALAAQTDLAPWRFAPFALANLRHLDDLIARTKDPSFKASLERLRPGFAEIQSRGETLDAQLDRPMTIDPSQRERIRVGQMRFGQAFIDPVGLDGRPWFQSLLAASDRNDGYAPCMLPLLAEALADGDESRVNAAVERTLRGQQRALDAMRMVETGLRPRLP